MCGVQDMEGVTTEGILDSMRTHIERDHPRGPDGRWVKKAAAPPAAPAPEADGGYGEQPRHMKIRENIREQAANHHRRGVYKHESAAAAAASSWASLDALHGCVRNVRDKLARRAVADRGLAAGASVAIGDRGEYRLRRGADLDDWDDQAVRAEFAGFCSGPTAPDAESVIAEGMDRFRLRGRFAATDLRNVGIAPDEVGEWEPYSDGEKRAYIEADEDHREKLVLSGMSLMSHLAFRCDDTAPPHPVDDADLIAAHELVQDLRRMRDEVADRIVADHKGSQQQLRARGPEGKLVTVGTLFRRTGSWKIDHDKVRAALLERYGAGSAAEASAAVLAVTPAGAYKKRWAQSRGVGPDKRPGRVSVEEAETRPA